MPKLDLDAIEQTNRTGYPPPFAAPMAKRHYRRLAPAGGHRRISASAMSCSSPAAFPASATGTRARTSSWSCSKARRCWSRTRARPSLRAGDCAAFPKGVANGHHLVNRCDAPCVFVAVGKPSATDCHYPDIDMHLDAASGRFTHKDGSAY